MSRVTYIQLSLSMILGGFFLSGCGLFSKNDPGVPSAQASICSIEDPAFRNSFKSTLHPSLQKACYECHNSLSPKAPSPFADDSPSIAMESAKRFVDFNLAPGSPIVKRMEQGHNCGSNCAGLAQEFTAKVEEWKNALGGSISKLSEDCSGLKDQDDAKIVKTAAKHIDSTIPAGGITLVYDLKDATPPIPNAAFQVRVRPFTAGTYMIDRPVLATQALSGNPDQNARISNIHILINGAENISYRNYVSTDFIVQPRAFPQGTQIFGWYIVKDATQIVTWSGPGGEDLSFELKLGVTNLLWTIPTTDPFRCNSTATFTTFFNLKRGDCLECHESGGAGYPYFPMKPVADPEVCRNFKMRSNPDDPLKSLFYLMPQQKVEGYKHPVEISFTVAEEDAIKVWLALEK